MFDRLRVIASRIRGLFSARRLDHDFEQELDSHLTMLTDENIRRGMSPDEARRAARLRLGNSAHLRESHHDLRTLPFLESLVTDIRYALRMLRKNPGFTAVAVLTLALGIGANTAIFTVVNAVLLKPLSLPNPDQLVTLRETFPPSGTGSVSFADLKTWQEQNRVFQGIAAYKVGSFNIKGNESPEQVYGAYVTPNMLDVMGMRPIIGRGFVQGEDVAGSDHVAVLSATLWHSLFNGNPAAIGQTLRLNSETFTIMGVMPDAFRLLLPNPTTQIWVPFVPTTAEQSSRGYHFLTVVGRLKAGVPLPEAQAQMATIMYGIAQKFPNEAGGRSVLVQGLKQSKVQDVRQSLLILFFAVALVFLIACLNVVNLLVARVMARQKEIGIRSALGATRWRLVRQFLAESLVLTLFGGGLGWLLALWGTDLLSVMKPAILPSLQRIKPDFNVLLYTLLLLAAVVLALGVAMALQSSRISALHSLKQGIDMATTGRGRGRVHGALVVSQIATAFVLLTCAALLTESFWHLLEVNPGFETEHVLTMQIALPAAKYSKDHPEPTFYQPVLEKIQGLPDVEAVGIVSRLPVQDFGLNTGVEIEGQPMPPLSESPLVEFRGVSPDYFRALGIPLVRGRYFAAHDNMDAPAVVIINKAMADRFFPNADPIGKRLRGLDDHWLPIVGVVGNTRQYGLSEPAHMEMDVCYLQSRLFSPQLDIYIAQMMSIAVRTRGEPTAVANSVREAVLSVDPDQAVSNIETMEEVISDSVASRRFEMLLLGAFAFLALVLATSGIYGVISYAAQQRTHEFGIRMALGARRLDVLGLVLGHGLCLAGIGVAFGLVGALAATRLLASLLYGVRPRDPLTLACVAGLLTAVGLLACYIPARRAMRVDPMVALRHE